MKKLIIMLVLIVGCGPYWNKKSWVFTPKQIVYKSETYKSRNPSSAWFVLGIGGYTGESETRVTTKKYHMFLEDQFGYIKGYTIDSSDVFFKVGKKPKVIIRTHHSAVEANSLTNEYMVDVKRFNIRYVVIYIPKNSIKDINIAEFGKFTFK